MKKLTALLVSALMLVTPAAGIVPGVSAASGAIDTSVPPKVLPALREWSDASGAFTVDSSVKLVNAEGVDAVNKVAEFFKELCGLNLSVAPKSSGGREIVFEYSKTLPAKVDDEGYTLNITKDKITVRAKTETGLLYGGITLVQMCSGEGNGTLIRCGSAVDYPEYKTRAGMLDVARAWIPLDYVKEITRYMAWYKLNEIHLHVSDNTGFRLESDVPGLSSVVNGEKRYYTKDAYRAYQKEMLGYGISVVTEIDTPSHSQPFANITSGGPKMIYSRLDITDANRDSTLEFVKKLWNEYLLGDDPVIVNKVVHIGTDEYGTGYNEEMRKYTAALAEYVYSLGYIPRNWAFLGPDGYPGTAEIPNYVQADMWDNGISGIDPLLDGGYDIINILNSRLYIVPGEVSPTGFPDRLNIRSLYSNWQVYDFTGWGVGKVIDADYEHLLGASFALWNDYHSLNRGMTRYDIFDRLRDMACLVAEKTWVGADTKNGSADEFMDRVELLGKRSGDADPGHHAFQGEINVDFSGSALPAGVTADGKISDGRFILDGRSYISFDCGTIGFPNTLEITLKLDSIPRTPILSGADGLAVYANADGRGHFGFKVDDYTFIFDYKLKAGAETTLLLTCDNKYATLVVDGRRDYTAFNSTNMNDTRMATLTLPLEKIGLDAKGYISKIRVSSAYTEEVCAVNTNLALNCDVTVSGTEVDYDFFPYMAVDGDDTTRVSFAKDKDDQWMVVDLGKAYDVTSVEIYFNERILASDVLLSADGKNYTKVYSFDDDSEEAKKTERTKFTDTILLDSPVNARYVRYEQHKRFSAWNTLYSGGILEFRVYTYERSAYEKCSSLLEQARKTIDSMPETNVLYAPAVKAYKALNAYAGAPKVYERVLNDLITRLQAALDGHPIDDDEDKDPDVSLGIDIPVSHLNRYNWSTYEAMMIVKDSSISTVKDVPNGSAGIAGKGYVMYVVELVDDRFVATKFIDDASIDTTVAPDGGFLLAVCTKNSAYDKAKGGALLGYEFVLVDINLSEPFAADTNANPNSARHLMAFKPESDEPVPESTPGDVNGDGNIDAVDYAMVKRAVLGTFKLDDAQSAGADVNGDGDVNAIDYAMIKRHVLGTYKIIGA